MARILITGSSDGIGLLTAQKLIKQSHSVVLHARNERRAEDTKKACPGAEAVLVGDLSSLAQTRALAQECNTHPSGRFDSIIHNAGIGYNTSAPTTEDGYDAIFQVNTLAPYLLTALQTRPRRLIYLSSGLHSGGSATLEGMESAQKSGIQAYSGSKLQDVILAFGVARRWPEVKSIAFDPGWVRTKMGGTSAPGDAIRPADVLAQLAVGDDVKTGKLYGVKGIMRVHEAAEKEGKQEELLKICGRLSGAILPS